MATRTRISDLPPPTKETIEINDDFEVNPRQRVYENIYENSASLRSFKPTINGRTPVQRTFSPAIPSVSKIAPSPLKTPCGGSRAEGPCRTYRRVETRIAPRDEEEELVDESEETYESTKTEHIDVLNTGETLKEHYGGDEYTTSEQQGKRIATDPVGVTCINARDHEEKCDKCKENRKKKDVDSLKTFGFYAVASCMAWGLATWYFVEA